jgi:enoyl-CoA hydratase
MTEIKKTPDGIEIPPPSPSDVLYEKNDGVAKITLNRPTVLNAMNKNVQRLLYGYLDQAEADEEVNVIILTGSGRAFSAGGDLYAYLYPDDDPAPSGTDVHMKVWELSKPVIAAVRGHAVGQGFELAGVCDITIAAEDARFGEIQIRHGGTPPTLIVPFLVGLKKAKEILLLGAQIGAEEAHNIGIVNRVVPVDKLQEEAESIAKRIASLPQGTVRMDKMLVNRAYKIAGILEAMAYRDDTEIKSILEEAQDDNLAAERRKLISEGGWGAFKETRDVGYEK